MPRFEYVLVRRRGRRGVGLKVDSRGLTVSAPLSMPLNRIEAAVLENERWVAKKLAEWSERRIPVIAWGDGASLPFLGEGVVLRVAQGGRNRVELVSGELRATVRDPAPEPLRRVVTGWYKRAAREHLGGRTFVLASAAGLSPPRFLLSSAMSRWGSCNTRGEIRITWRLVKARPALVDYVICHELAHLRHMNHSRAFWAEVERQCPAYRELRKELLATDHLYRAF